MPKRHRSSPDTRALLEQILEAGRRASPPLSAAEFARRVQLTPATLSRMKKNGSGDIAVIAEMARVVGMRLTLVPDDATLSAIQSGRFFDD